MYEPSWHCEKCLLDLQRLHELQKILGFETQQLGGGGAISLGPGQSFQYQEFSGSTHAITIGQILE
jgi:hypothetical protein